MISFRRAALLGLNAPLSAIMLAVLGIWPRPDDEAPALPPIVSGPDGPSASSRSRDHEEDPLDRVRREIEIEEQARRNMAIMLATVTALAECVV